MKAKSKSEIDEYVGARIREGRVALNLSQEQLARALGVSFQQIQNYEKGANGVSAVRLFDICKILNVSLASMFPQDRPNDPPGPFTRFPLDHPAGAGMRNAS
jgi:transcriptional regulator with XRE-family HTH domain